MNINRHNYEEFFLLYIDNELSVSDKKLVDDFVSNNPDLVEEFDNLKSVILFDDAVEFNEKFSLYKKEVPITAEEEKMLLLLDKELTGKEAFAVSATIAQDASLQKNWDLLQQTVLDKNEVLVFEDKQSLYKKEPSRIVYARFARWAAAAILIGFGVYSLFISKSDVEIPSTTTLSKNEGAGKVIIDSKNNSAVAINDNPETTAHINQQTDVVVNKDAQDLTPNKMNSKITDYSSPKNSNTAIQTSVSQTSTVASTQQTAQIQNTNNQIEPTLTLASVQTATIKNVEPEKIDTYIATKPTKKVEITDVNVLEAKTNSYARHASSTDEPNDKILYMDEEDVSKSKAGVLLRKLKRTIERKTKINTGDGSSVKIAGFEIALK